MHKNAFTLPRWVQMFVAVATAAALAGCGGHGSSTHTLSGSGGSSPVPASAASGETTPSAEASSTPSAPPAPAFDRVIAGCPHGKTCVDPKSPSLDPSNGGGMGFAALDDTSERDLLDVCAALAPATQPVADIVGAIPPNREADSIENTFVGPPAIVCGYGGAHTSAGDFIYLQVRIQQSTKFITCYPDPCRPLAANITRQDLTAHGATQHVYGYRSTATDNPLDIGLTVPIAKAFSKSALDDAAVALVRRASDLRPR